MTSATVIGFMALGLAILAHTAALFYWGGKTARLLETHDKEIQGLRDWKHDEVRQGMTAMLLELGVLKERMDEFARTREA